MTTLPDLRAEIAAAVTGVGIPCEPYPPDAPSPPCAFVDTVTVNRDQMQYASTGVASVRLTHLGLRNDRESAGAELEGRVAEVSTLLTGLGCRVVEIVSGLTQIGGVDLPAVQYAMLVNI